VLANTDVVLFVLCYWRNTPRWSETRRMTEEEKRTAYRKAMKPLVESGTQPVDEFFDIYLSVQKFINSLHPDDAVEFLEELRKDASNKHVKLFFNAMSYRVGDPSGEEARAILAAGLNEEAQDSLPARKGKTPSRGKKKSVRAHLTRDATVEKENVEEENVEEENVEEIQHDPNPKTKESEGKGRSTTGRRVKSRKGADEVQDGVELGKQMEVEVEEVVTKKRKGKRAQVEGEDEDPGSDAKQEEDIGREKNKGKQKEVEVEEVVPKQRKGKRARDEEHDEDPDSGAKQEEEIGQKKKKGKQQEVEVQEVVPKKRKGKGARVEDQDEDPGSDDEEVEDNGRGKRKEKQTEVEIGEAVPKKQKGKRGRYEDQDEDPSSGAIEEEDSGREKKKGKRKKKHPKPKVSKAGPILNRLPPLMPLQPLTNFDFL
jgi:hypothetical protein